MSGQKRLPPWHENFRLRDGRELLIRPIRQEDAAPIRGAFELLEPIEIRQRFLTTMAELPADQAARLCSPDPRTEFALVAAEPLPPGEALVGAVARARVLPDGQQAEYAVLVSRFIAGQGVGRHLMRRLVKWARGRNLRQLLGDVQHDNQPMLQLVRSLGFRVLPERPAQGLVRVVLDLDTADGRLPAETTSPV
ncbi:GNAT family N-acetyltransferase [Pseudoxanthomonas winnipegensis]|uniref:GNAT family N-acetyltransferase n=1 Tax=Pseudoxanthomonas winnipegensis TaxID=2480810 RepID=UPI00257643B6|nr:GNAT family N-acetyltransferase [Pseudoxanthomonas winnipegensis]WJI17445.1 GNAT family N-acetyltransferase [Pseudoxanthomonas winnipegensis]